jgi:hypothetical protein
MLKQFEIHPKTIRIGGETRKGYDCRDFFDVWRRYLPEEAPSLSLSPIPPEKSVPSVTSVTDKQCGERILGGVLPAMAKFVRRSSRYL